MRKSGAIELSIGTIVIIVLSLTMLILGIVLVRSIMCGAIGLTSETSSKAKGEIDKLFGATAGEVQCIGNGGESVIISPGKTNIIWCGIRAPIQGEYEISVKDIAPVSKGAVTSTELKKWMGTQDKWKGPVAPNDELPKKVARLDIPDNAPEVNIIVQVVAKKDGVVVSTQDLDFAIRRQGLIKAAMC